MLVDDIAMPRPLLPLLDSQLLIFFAREEVRCNMYRWMSGMPCLSSVSNVPNMRSEKMMTSFVWFAYDRYI